MDIFAEEFRANMLGNISSKIASKENALLESEKMTAKLREEYENLKLTKSRLASEDCPPLVCPSCFYERHSASQLLSIEYRTEGVDLFECKVCKREWEQPEQI